MKTQPAPVWKQLCVTSAVMFTFSIGSAQDKIVLSDSLYVRQVSQHTFVHISGQYVKAFGRFTSNGVIHIREGEAVIMDTPPSTPQSIQLLDWLAKDFPDVKIKAVVINHFHSDCLGGLSVFHDRGIPSYANARTPQLLALTHGDFAVPQHVFEIESVIKVGDGNVISFFPGEAHTKDNIVTYIEDDGILFGGCMVKSLNAGKGNVADANMGEWSETINHVRQRFPTVKIVVPGHGDWGGQELLDFTIQLFR